LGSAAVKPSGLSEAAFSTGPQLGAETREECGVSLVMVEIEEVPVQILYGELP
jgi:hypothetical protein